MENRTIEILIKNRVKEVVNLGNSIFSKPLDADRINVIFKTKGRAAGWANYYKMTLNFNLILASENLPEFLNQVVPHEVAHLFTDRNYPNSTPHGREWKNTMIRLGCTPDRTHRMDTTTVKSLRKQQIKHNYTCDCGRNFIIGDIRHKNIMKGKRFICPKCRGVIRPV